VDQSRKVFAPQDTSRHNARRLVRHLPIPGSVMSNVVDHASAGAEALQKGDAQKARDCFSRALANGHADSRVMLGLAHSCKALSDREGQVAALERLLAIEPRNIPALILRADCYADAGDSRSASAYYQMAIRAAPPPASVPAELAPELRRAQQMCERYAEQYKIYLRQRLAEKGFDEARSSARFAQSLDIVLGKKQIYVQQPRYYYFPTLPQIQFYDRAVFPWLDEVEAATDDIRAELLEVMKDPGAFAPYVEGHSNRPYKDQMGMLNNPAWSAFYLWKNGDAVPANAARCTKTLQALKNAPLARVPYRSPSILFSLLRPGAKIPPHNGLVNTRLICHLPLIVPGKCAFRVGNDVREWVEGKSWAFDDTIEHEAWNASDRTRVILLFDVWRPELTEEERSLIVSLFEAIDAHSGKRPDWEI
jgi:aspartyl/asparaginyl beta-hydroxylase (cupin superfamily)